jgi:hypothetical protein
MSFPEKSAIVMTATLAAVYGTYFAVVLRWLANAPAEEIVYQPLMIVATIPLAIFAAVSHIIIAIANPKAAEAYDERDRLIDLKGEQVGGYVLAVGVFAGLVLTMMEVPYFFIANALLAGWVLAEITTGAIKIVLYRRGA